MKLNRFHALGVIVGALAALGLSVTPARADAIAATPMHDDGHRIIMWIILIVVLLGAVLAALAASALHAHRRPRYRRSL